MKKESPLYTKFSGYISEHFKNKQYDLVLHDFRSMFFINGFATEFKYFALARTAYGLFKNNNEYKDYWSTLSTPCMRHASYIANNLINCTQPKELLLENFISLVDELFEDDLVKNNIVCAFKMIVDATLISSDIDSSYSYSNPSKHHNFIAVSGYGWSGSGAILDYFREFNNVEPVFGELGILEENYGFKFFVKNITNARKLFVHAIKFFFINLICCYDIESLAFYKPMRSSYRVLNKSKDLIAYSLQIKSIAHLLASLIIESKRVKYEVFNVKQILQSLSKQLLDLITLDIPSNKIPVLDNSIHIKNVDLLNYISGVTVVCSLRDPRSIYISMLKEKPGFIKDPHSFIKEQSDARREIDSSIALLDKNALENLIILNFEDFVLNKECRHNLINKLELNLKDWGKPEQYFKPYESSKNVTNYIDCKDKDIVNDIHLIGKELNVYCRNM